MTVKEASTIFRLNEPEIRKRYRDKMIIGAYKSKNRIIIPDDTSIIPSKAEVRALLLHILKKKNNPYHIIPSRLSDDNYFINVIVGYMEEKDLISIEHKDTIRIDDIKITDEGFGFLMSNNSNYCEVNLIGLQINPTAQIGLINISL